MIYKKRFYSSSVKITFGLHQFGEIHIAKWNSPYQPFKKIIFLFNECEISTQTGLSHLSKPASQSNPDSVN